MAVNITDENLAEYLSVQGDAVENRNLIPAMQEDEIDYTVSFPAVKFDKDPSVNPTAKPQDFRQVYFKTFWNKILEGYNMAADAVATLTGLKEVIDEAVEEVEEAVDTVQGAENVDANLSTSQGAVLLTVVNRQGVSTTKDVGWRIYRTYATATAMEADAANVPEGKFVMISSTVEDPDNAKMYVRSGYAADDPDPTHTTFNFVCDFSGAQGMKGDTGDKGDPFTYDDFTPAQIADLKRPATDAATQITTEWQGADGQGGIKAAAIAATTSANSAATLANTKAGLADTAATAANTAAAYANTEGDYAKAQGDIAKDWNDHQPFIGDGISGDQNYWYIWFNGTYVKSVYAKGDDLHWDEMSQQEKDDLAARVLAQLTFASVQTCEDIIDELT